jgi:hypothetical protein
MHRRGVSFDILFPAATHSSKFVTTPAACGIVIKFSISFGGELFPDTSDEDAMCGSERDIELT